LQQEYRELGIAVLKQACRDLARFSRFRTGREYRSARRFLDTDLFDRICRVSGTDPVLMRNQILQRVGQAGKDPVQAPTSVASREYRMQAAEASPPYIADIGRRTTSGRKV
jgi:hypothetical protein